MLFAVFEIAQFIIKLMVEILDGDTDTVLGNICAPFILNILKQTKQEDITYASLLMYLSPQHLKLSC